MLSNANTVLNCGFWTFLNECFRQFNYSLSHNMCFILHSDHPITLILSYLTKRYLLSITLHKLKSTLLPITTHLNSCTCSARLLINPILEIITIINITLESDNFDNIFCKLK